MQTFLTKLAVLMHKVPGILLLVAIFISMDGAQIVATWAGTPLAPYMAGALKVVGYVGTILALLKQLKPGPLADAIDKAVKSGTTVAKTPPVPPLAMLSVIVVVCAACLGCTPTQVQTAEATVPADAQLALCIANVAEADAGKAVSQVILDELAQCTADIVPIVTVLDGRIIDGVARGATTIDAANVQLQAIHAAAKLPAPKFLVAPVHVGGHAFNLPSFPPMWTLVPAPAERSVYGVVMP